MSLMVVEGPEVERATRAIGEEFGEYGNQDTRWVVDPIDGTKNFVRHILFWATLIALGDHGEVVAGVIHNPVSGELYTARRGGGAFLNGAPVRVSPVRDVASATLLHAGLGLVRKAGYASAASATTSTAGSSPRERPHRHRARHERAPA
jgi:myo-inositol-1(or 4)-monophosphatase